MGATPYSRRVPRAFGPSPEYVAHRLDGRVVHLQFRCARLPLLTLQQHGHRCETSAAQTLGLSQPVAPAAVGQQVADGLPFNGDAEQATTTRE